MSIGFENVPAFALALDLPVEVPQVGTVTVDVAWGGMFYALVEAEALGLAITPDEGRDIVRLGEMVKAAAREQIPAVHPTEPSLAGITIIELTGPPTVPGAHGRNTVVVSSGSWTGRVPSRSPACWTDPRAAPGPAPGWRSSTPAGKLPIGQDYVHEGILGTTWTGHLLRETRSGRSARSSRASPAAPGSPGRPSSWSPTTTPSPTDSPSATCGG